MYFFKKAGKQHIDLTGDFILSHNDALIKSRSLSAGPQFISEGTHYDNVTKRSILGKIQITIKVIRFIWGLSKALTVEQTNYNKPIRND